MISIKIDVSELKKASYELSEYRDKLKNTIIEVVRQNAVGLMYDLIGSTMPFPKGNKSGGGTLEAFNNGMNGYFATIYNAFKPIQVIPFGVLAVNRDTDSMLAYGFRFESEILQKEFDNNNFEAIYHAFHNSGVNEDKQYKIENDATMELLFDFKNEFSGHYKDVKKYDSYYIRNTETIEKLRRAGNQAKVGTMAGGWLKCALKIGGKPDKYTNERKPIWMYKFGKGNATISADKKTITCTNLYGNFGGWASSSEIQDVISKRMTIMQKTAEEELKKLQ